MQAADYILIFWEVLFEATICQIKKLRLWLWHYLALWEIGVMLDARDLFVYILCIERIAASRAVSWRFQQKINK